MRILIVEDEIVSRTKMSTIMRSFGECRAAENGQQALAEFETALQSNKAFDLMTLDINLPDMQGTKVLEQIRDTEKKYNIAKGQRCFIIMVTAQSDSKHVLNCINIGCDDYISKPFKIETIRKKLDNYSLGKKLGETEQIQLEPSTKSNAKIEDIFININKALRSGELNLPSLPLINIKFGEMIAANADIEEVAGLLKQDMVIASKLIRVANSVRYRGFGLVQTIEQAVGRLGLTTTEQMVSAFAHQKLFAIDTPKYRNMLNNLWRHSLSSAFAADILTSSLSLKLPINAFAAGLFHDVGALALIQITAEMEKRNLYLKSIDAEAILETVRCHHAVFGAKLLQKWKFEFDFMRVALYHNSLHTADSITDDLLVVHLANQVAKSLGHTIFPDIENLALSETPSAQQLKVDSDQLTVLQQNVREQMQQTADLGV